MDIWQSVRKGVKENELRLRRFSFREVWKILFLFFSVKMFDFNVNPSKFCIDHCCYYPKIVWTYHNDENNIAEDVKEMLDISKQSLVNFTHILLTDKNLSNFFNISSFPLGYHKTKFVHRVSYIKFSLLEKYGGVYYDSTTYITSGAEMEWLFSQAASYDAEMFAFGGMNKTYFGVVRNLFPNFVGACQYSLYLKEFKKHMDEIMMGDVEAYCIGHGHCKNKSKGGYDCWLCFDEIFGVFLHKNPDLSKKTLTLPINRSHYRLRDECQRNNECYKERLLHDPKVRSYPFVKVSHHLRTGKKLNFTKCAVK